MDNAGDDGRHDGARRGRPRMGRPFMDDRDDSDDDEDEQQHQGRAAMGRGGVYDRANQPRMNRGERGGALGGDAGLRGVFGEDRRRDGNAGFRNAIGGGIGGGQRGFRLEARGGGFQRGGGRGRERGGARGGAREGDRRGKRKLDMNFLRELKTREESDVALTLSHPESGFRACLKDAIHSSDRVALIISVLARAFLCNSLPENLTILFTIIKEARFFDTAINFFFDMLADEGVNQTSFREPISDMITIMEELMEKNPNCITEFIGIHSVLKDVIDSLRQTSTVINADILKRFQEFTEQKDKKLNRQRKRVQPRPTPEEIEQGRDIEGPPDDFRDIEIFPQTADMQPNDGNYLRKNKVRGQYEDLDHYLDVQFRLLREDFVAPLREGVNNYIEATAMTGNQRKGKKFQDIRIYNNVRLIAPYSTDVGICHILQFDISRMQVRWQSSKRLIYGSLLCLSHDNFRTIYFATVTHRDIEELQRGHVCVRLEVTRDVIAELWGKTFTMAETTAYFESYKHVLLGLQKTRPGDLPFEKYILKCDSQVQPPAYIRRNQASEYDLRPLVDEDMVIRDESRLENPGLEIAGQRNYNFSQRSAEARHVTILDRETWPPADLLHLDTSQYEAIHTALTNEFVITQGPPGTGKTYIGLKIVKALLHNKALWSVNPVTGNRDPRPMLIVCYTNHALDQFLEGIVSFYKGDLIRIGSRSQSEVLKEYNLHNFRQRFRHERNVPVQIFQARREARNEMESLLGKINIISNKIQIATTQILHEDFLQPFMGTDIYQRLTQQFEMMLQVYPEAREVLRRGYSVIVEWLGLGNLAPIVEMEGNIPAEMNQNAIGNINEPEVELIDVEDEVDVIQAQRQLDNGDDDDLADLLDHLDLLDVRVSRKEVNDLKIRQAINDQMKAVAMKVEHMTEKPRNVNEFDWQYQKNERKRLKKQTQRNLASNDIMTEEEARRFGDLWRMKPADKWRMYRLWIRKYCDFLRSDINETEEEYEAAAARHKEALMQEDKEIMRHSTVIGMTTTGAARYQSILQEIKPRIIVVEEAAEVLEAHIITTLSRGCEHLILIGDHKQLRPNPTVYTLAKNYNLDVSLFERMATNGLRCDSLELQHRMRPEIAELMKHIYKGLRNHKSVLQYDDIKGISSNMYFIDHKQGESDDVDLKSHSNVHEAHYIVALCKYLLLQGYEPNQITVLTLYSGQLFCLRSMMPKDQFDGIRVTVVDNYQGEENEIVLLSLVRSNEEGSIGFLKVDNRICVALSRAKKGFYVIGNFELLANHSTLWKEIVIDMTNKQLLSDGLLLHCQNHPDDDGIVARDPKDFDRAPEGGCNKMCEFRLKCGHVCRMYCHILDKDHTDYECAKPCNKFLCDNGHRCKRRCYQECGDCTEMVEKRLPKCGHTQRVPCHQDPSTYPCQEPCKKTLPCQHSCQSKCGNACTDECTVYVEHTWLCGHSGMVPCYKKSTGSCPEPCGSMLECQHLCSGNCGTCFEGRLHRACSNNCSRILVCGHECQDRCNLCPPCTMKCANRCKHSKCGRRCGELCAPCMEPCDWRCQHHRCTRLCHEPCDRPRCDKPCRKRLQCGHECIGLCGERCPNDCRICDKDKVTEIFLGTEDEPGARFVLLEDCRNRCIIEYTAMDQYMDTKVENGEIQLKSCPKCNTPIRKSRRYGTIINKALMEIEDVKKQILSNKERLRSLEEDIADAILDETIATKATMRRRLKLMEQPRTEHALTAMKNQLTFLQSIRKLVKDWNELKGISVSEERAKGLQNLERFTEWALEERSIMTPQETADAEMEISRSKDHLRILLYQKQLSERRKTVDAGFRNRVREAERVLTKSGKYTEKKKADVGVILNELNKLLGGLGISDDERLMIVQAMALPKGHWFQCPRGHVYAIGDCGGATSSGRCPECHSEIGGTGYALRPGNVHTGAMDQSENPAWSNATNLEDGFDIQFVD